ncbi:hypothetical protein [Streptomyces sp. NPDC049881]|uniref:hypothetical protein n=1 Tax=unclassified Streptomyces TaxID=2593676 RepID=UPI003428A611
MKQNQASSDRTWSDVGFALAWLEKSYRSNPPFERPGREAPYADLAAKLDYAADVLPRGVDVSWVYYLPSKSLISFSVVCCPNHFHPAVECPAPPS